jgi:hypothetical protein
VGTLQGGADSAGNTSAPITTNLTREIVMPVQRTTLLRVCAQCGNPLRERWQQQFCSVACRYATSRTPEYRAALFWSHVDKHGPVPDHRPELGACWLWTGMRDRGRNGGYGYSWDGRRTIRAHIHAYALTHGPITGGLCVLHHCENRPCVRPAHLFLGTRKDNIHDMIAKGRDSHPSGDLNGNSTHPERRPRGENNGRAVLTEAMVIDIHRRLALGETCAGISRSFGVAVSTIHDIKRGKRWGHIKPESQHEGEPIPMPGFDVPERPAEQGRPSWTA